MTHFLWSPPMTSICLCCRQLWSSSLKNQCCALSGFSCDWKHHVQRADSQDWIKARQVQTIRVYWCPQTSVHSPCKWELWENSVCLLELREGQMVHRVKPGSTDSYDRLEWMRKHSQEVFNQWIRDGSGVAALPAACFALCPGNPSSSLKTRKDYCLNKCYQ